jgi:hypothetical protein
MTALLLARWRLIAWLAPILVLGLVLAIRTHERDAARNALRSEQAAHALFVARAGREAAELEARFSERARRAERAAGRISQETIDDYQTRLADLRRRYDALRLREPDRTGAGRAGEPHLPGLSGTAGRADAAAGGQRLSDRERFIATEQALRLEALQMWVRRQREEALAQQADENDEADESKRTPTSSRVTPAQ